ncbi:MAG: tRNA (adenosine(37)-N6)-threonylcarbamoyltransferase complex dimerization subunit type 1 TsaB [Gammaproteobacteria bacterium]
MKILALDTSAEACSAALLHDEQISDRSEIAPRRHAELILPMIDELLTQAGLRLTQLDAIAFGRGPGAFTGVRIAAGVTQGLAYATDLPVIAVSSLAALAQSASGEDSDSIFAAMDARLGEIYYCQYQLADGYVRPLSAEAVAKPEQVEPDTGGTIFGIGSGWDTYHDILQDKCRGQLSGCEPQAFPLAVHLVRLAVPEYQQGNLQAPQAAVPVYLRNKVTG